MSDLDNLGETILLGSIYANTQQQHLSTAEMSRIMAINTQILTMKSTEEHRLKERRDLVFNIRKAADRFMQLPHLNATEAAFEWTLLNLYFYGDHVSPSHFFELTDKEYAFQTETLLTDGRQRSVSQVSENERIQIQKNLFHFLNLDELEEYNQLLTSYPLYFREVTKHTSESSDRSIGCLAVGGIGLLLLGILLYLSGIFELGIVMILVGGIMLWGVKKTLEDVYPTKSDLPYGVKERYTYLKSRHGERNPDDLREYVEKMREYIIRFVPVPS